MQALCTPCGCGVFSRKEATMQKAKLKLHNLKRGFSLAELSVVLLLVAILSAMTVTFSVTIGKYSKSVQAEYDYASECDSLKESVIEWAYENAVSGTSVSVAEKKELFIGNEKYPLGEFMQIKDVSFDVQSNVIKIIIEPKNEKFESKIFVFYLRTGGTENG